MNMKWSTKILQGMALIVVAGLLASNLVLKKEFDKVDKNDTYWTFAKVLEKPFKYLQLEGGNITNILFTQSPNYTVRISNDWKHGHTPDDLFHAQISGDTLYIKFVYISQDEGEKNWMKRMDLVRIFAPELRYVGGFNTNFEMEKLAQKSIAVNISGRSKFEVESFIPEMDSISVIQKDTAEVVFEMSPEYKAEPSAIGMGGKINIFGPESHRITSSQSMTLRALQADLKGYSLLDVGHAQIGSVHLKIADSSAVILSGQALRTYQK
jgi:hypothetical protein